jgi:hypothetical protein
MRGSALPPLSSPCFVQLLTSMAPDMHCSRRRNGTLLLIKSVHPLSIRMRGFCTRFVQHSYNSKEECLGIIFPRFANKTYTVSFWWPGESDMAISIPLVTQTLFPSFATYCVGACFM